MNYYEKEIYKLGTVERHETPAKIQIISEDNRTKWLDLNKESALALMALCLRILNEKGA